MPANNAKKARQRKRKIIRNNVIYVGLFGPENQRFTLEALHHVSAVREALISNEHPDPGANFLLHVTEMNLIITLTHSGIISFEPLSMKNHMEYFNLRRELVVLETAIMVSFQPMDLVPDGTTVQMELGEFARSIPTVLCRIAYFDVKRLISPPLVETLAKAYAVFLKHLLSLAQVSSSIEVAVPHIRVQTRHDDRFDKLLTIDFLRFHEVSNFPQLLNQWLLDNADYIAAEDKKFNCLEVQEWMDNNWAAAMQEPDIVFYGRNKI